MDEKKPIGQLLLELGYITEEQIQIALEVQKIKKGLFGEILLDLAFVSPFEIAEAIAYQSKRPLIDLSQIKPSEDALLILDKSIAKQLIALPFEKDDNHIKVALANPYDINAIDIIKRRAGRDIEVYVSDKESILKYIEIYYFLLDNPINEEIDKILKNFSPNNVPKLVELFLNHAIIERATDIHISPENIASHIFFRIDGVIKHYYAIPIDIHHAIVSRLKILANLNIAEQRIPQDGSFTHTFFEEEFDLRISTVPTTFGENVVLRILSKNVSLFNLKNLGFEPKMLKILEKQFSKPQGIILVTGPTGSGKTTTLYAALRKINALKRNILTVEDPIEYKFPFIKQTQVNERAGYTFARAIRAFLRQDPDVILIGEIRDEETAEMAIRASITGHLVLSTLHTNDSVSSIPRLIDMGIKDYMVASGITAITAQRLVRKVCSFCKKPYKISADILMEYGFEEETIKNLTGVENLNDEIILYKGEGCSYCKNTGYLGRILLGEVLIISEKIADLIVQGATPLAIKIKAKEEGMVFLKEDGLIKAVKGITTVEEVIRVVG